MFTCSIHSQDVLELSPDTGSPFLDQISQEDPHQLPSNLSAEDLRRTRNRLAQRKHRQRKKMASQGQDAQDSYGLGTSADIDANSYMVYSKTQKNRSSARRHSLNREGRRHRSSFHRYQTNSIGNDLFSTQAQMGGTIDGVDISLVSPTSSSYNNNQSPDAARLVLPQLIPNLNSPDYAPQFAAKNARQHYSDNMPFTCECGSISGTSQTQFAAQLSHHIHTQQLPTPQEQSPAQQCAFPLTPGTIHDRGAPFSASTYSPHTPAQDQLPQRWQPEVDMGSEGSSRSYGDIEVDPINSESPTSHPPPANPTTANMIATAPIEKAVNLETRFTHILDAIEEAGFDGIDSMATTYYTCIFKSSSALHSAQTLSRSRHLRRLLVRLGDSSRSWAPPEKREFQEGISWCAERLYADELCRLRSGSGESDGTTMPLVENVSRKTTRERIAGFFLDPEVVGCLKEERRVLREKVPEIWSLLMELSASTGFPQPQCSQIVSAFLCVLMLR